MKSVCEGEKFFLIKYIFSLLSSLCDFSEGKNRLPNQLKLRVISALNSSIQYLILKMDGHKIEHSIALLPFHPPTSFVMSFQSHLFTNIFAAPLLSCAVQSFSLFSVLFFQSQKSGLMRRSILNESLPTPRVVLLQLRPRDEFECLFHFR